MENTVLIIEDEEINREILANILDDTYNVLEAKDGEEALEILRDPKVSVSAIITDLIMPNMDGYKFLEFYGNSPEIQNIPVIVSSSESGPDSEVKCLECGAWDYIKKPYNARIIRFRVKNVIERSELYVLRKLRYQEQFDTLTGIYIKDMFVRQTQKMLENHPEMKFMLLHLDIYKFQTYNSVFGMKEGDNLLRHIADLLRKMAREEKAGCVTFCRIEADTFCVCMPAGDDECLQKIVDHIKKDFRQYKDDYDILPNMGVYYIKDDKEPISRMIDQAKLASKEYKGSYIQSFYVYTDAMGQEILEEQHIINGVERAMKEEQFVLYLQPKYELVDYKLEGAEALVRWKDPEKGMISPGKFIPIFEKNGLIMRLDYYIWEHCCKMIRKWLDEGKEPVPVSVNISRVSMYNPRVVEEIHELVVKYNIPPWLFQLELTESAYTNNSDAIRKAMSQLQTYGFSILMDDFGSGYSSLNVLKDIEVDALKLDMKFMSNSENPQRSQSIVASVIRLAKELDLPVIAEGVELREQVDFLRGVGCEYVQGYYFARPMPVEEFEKLAFQ